MYDRIIGLLTERSKKTRARIAAMGGTAAFKQAAGAQKPDQLAATKPGGVKAAADRLKGRDRLPKGSQPAVAIGPKKVGMGSTGRAGGRQPRVPNINVMQSISRGTSAAQKAKPAAQGGTVPSRAKFKLNRVRQQLNREKLAANAPKNADDARNRTDSRVLQNIKASQKARSSSGFAGLASREAGRRRMRAKAAAQTPSKQQAPRRTTPVSVQPVSSKTGRATKPGAGNIQQALQGGGTTITQVGLKKLAPFLRAGLRTSKVGPVI